MALSPLLLAGGGAYTAGVAANAAAEDMFEQTAKGTAASKALGSGALTAGAEVAGAKLSKMKNEVGKDAIKELATKIKRLDKVSVKQVHSAIKSDPDLAKDLLKGLGFEAGRESGIYLVNYLADQVIRDPKAAPDFSEFAQSVALDKASGFLEGKEKKLGKEIEHFWNTLG